MSRHLPTTVRRRRGVPGTVARVLLVVLAALGIGVVGSRSDTEPTHGGTDRAGASAHRAIEELVAPGPTPEALAALPADFEAVTGSSASIERGRDGTRRAVNPAGGCSAPWGEDNTRWDFGTACRAHDLGYDLLRYAEEKGTSLRPEVRRSLDERLSADMDRICTLDPRGSRAWCDSVAAVYSAGLEVNSWHQRWGPPVGEPLAPLLAGVVAIGSLLSYRLRDRLLPASGPRFRPRVRSGAGTRQTSALRGGGWTVVGVGGVALVVSGEVVLSVVRWAGADGAALWPLTWLAQTTVVFFFALGHANATHWAAVRRAGGGVREFLSHRGNGLLRLTLVFAVVAFAVPIALELLRVPRDTAEGVVRLALHPLWLLGLYLLTVISTPLMSALHRRAPRTTPAVLVMSLGAVEWLRSPQDVGDPSGTASLSGHVAALLVALSAQQLAFGHRDGLRPGRRGLLAGACAGAVALAAGVFAGWWPAAVLAVGGAPPALSGPAPAVLLLGLVHLGILGTARPLLARLAGSGPVARAAGLASRAPMSLYLLFLAATLVVVAAVHLPERFGVAPGWWLRPRTLLALTLLVGPAVVVFSWVERHGRHRPFGPPVGRATRPAPRGFLDRVATFAGFGFAVTGVFGFAVTTLGGRVPALDGLLLDPVQSLVQLLLGAALLHSARRATTATPVPWVLMSVACVPPLLSVTADSPPDPLGLAVHLAAGVFGLGAAIATVLSTPRSPARWWKS